MKRSQSSATDIVLSGSTSSQVSIASLPQSASGFSLVSKMKPSASGESVITVYDSEDKENVPVARSASSNCQSTGVSRTTTTASLSSRNPLSSSEINQLAEPRLYKLAEPISKLSSSASRPDYGDFLANAMKTSLPKTSTKLSAALPKKTTKKRGRRKKDSSSESETETEELELPSRRSPSRSRSRSRSVSTERADTDHDEEEEEEEVLISDQEESDMPDEGDEDPGAFSLSSIETLTSRFTRPEFRLKVHLDDTKSLDNNAFFDLLMSVHAIDTCISQMYFGERQSQLVKQPVLDLHTRLTGKSDRRIDLSQLIRCVLVGREEYLRLAAEGEGGAANYYHDLVKYLVEIIVHLEPLSFLKYCIFGAKIKELYEEASSSASLPAFLSLLVSCSAKMQRSNGGVSSDREQYRDMDLEQLGERMNDKKKLNILKITKVELASRLRKSAEMDSQSRDLSSQLLAVEHLQELDPTAKVHLVKLLVDMVMFDGLTYRAFVNDVRSKKAQAAQGIKVKDETLRELEGEHQITRPGAQDAGPMLDHLKLSAKKKYFKELDTYHSHVEAFNTCKHLLARIVRPAPVCSVSAKSDADLHELNLWSFDNLMPNYLLVQKSITDLEFFKSKSSWSQIADVGAFVKSLKILLPSNECARIVQSLTKCGLYTRNSPAKATEEATTEENLGFLAALNEFQDSQALTTKKPITRKKRGVVEEDDGQLAIKHLEQPASFLREIIKKMDKIYQRLLVSNFHRFSIVKDEGSTADLERHKIVVGEEFVNLTETWPVVMEKLKQSAKREAYDPTQKAEILASLVVLCQLLWKSFYAESTGLSPKMIGEGELGQAFSDYLQDHGKSFGAIDLYVTILERNIQWEKSLEQTECVICQETSIEGASLAQNTKLKCTYSCEATFHHGCLSYDEDEESKIAYFFMTGKVNHKIRCNLCMYGRAKLEEEKRQKSNVVESIEVNDYRLRAKRNLVDYRIFQKDPRTISRKPSKSDRTSGESTRSTSSGSWGPRATKASAKRKNADDDDDDEEEVVTKKSKSRSSKTYDLRPEIAPSRSLRTRKPVNYKPQIYPEESSNE